MTEANESQNERIIGEEGQKQRLTILRGKIML